MRRLPRQPAVAAAEFLFTIPVARFLCLATIVSLFYGSRASAEFVDVSAAVGLQTELKKSWGNPIWGDINNDGFLDLIVPTHGLPAGHGPFVYLNNCGTNFIDIRSTCGIEHGGQTDDGDWHGFAFGDLDGDGKLDLYIAEGAKGSQGGTDKSDLLFRGNGDGTFTNISVAAGIPINRFRGRAAYWFDYDNDGQLDLFVKNFGGANMLFRNVGGGNLTPVSDCGDLEFATDGEDFGSIMGFADFDNDGHLDVVITGDQEVQALYRNHGDGTFSDVTAASGMVRESHAKGVAWGDYDNDGFVDLFIARGHQRRSGKGASLYHNNGNGTFTDVTKIARVGLNGTCWSAIWGDYDNDGYLDLFVTYSGKLGDGVGNANRLFHNNGNGTFTNVAGSQGVAMNDEVSLHSGAAWADFDNDGFLDLLVKDGIGVGETNGELSLGRHFLFRNTPNGNGFLELNLLGVRSNRQGLGARVSVTTNLGRTYYRQNTGDGGGYYASQGSGPLHFGIAQATQATVTVHWPSGVVDVLPQVPANCIITVTEGSSELTRRP